MSNITHLYEIVKKKLKLVGFDLSTFIHFLPGFWFYINDYSKIKKSKGNDNSFKFGPRNPVLNDRFTESGTMSGHYFHQDLYVARKIFENNPQRHIDVGSRTDGFVAHVAVFREIEVIDIRELVSKVKNVKFRRADLMQLPEDIVDAYDSVSSLHAIEHFGLGRYGDPIDYFGHLKGIDNLTKILRKGGKLYFSVPIGPQRVEFNAHRVFNIEYLLKTFDTNFELNSFSYVDDKGDFHEDVILNDKDIKSNMGCKYGCGIFELTKK